MPPGHHERTIDIPTIDGEVRWRNELKGPSVH